MIDLSTLAAQLEGELPPFDKWQPNDCGDIAIHIDANAGWHYQGSPITRQPLVALFAKVLTKEGERFVLKTPAEKVTITVEDAPFMVVTWREQTTEQGIAIICVDNLEREWLLGENHTLIVKSGVPYLSLYHGLEAKVSRNVLYQWAEIAQEENGQYFITSAGQSFAIS